ncbi:uncharacterized protein LOC126603499 [Malus sylvestris]|uniref:uncharacterized protein LOC126603499 n=1 Tax=Malus sylvestris TaxID=3752 RepID=UPI0021ABDE07|nr:uncharacterized protein LOC126603499 [Malus sylvestris]
MASTPREEPTNASEVSPQRAPAPGVIFLLTDLHLAEGFDANFTELEWTWLESDDPADPFDDIHATYAAPLNFILESPINKAHMVLAVHINSENTPGCYEIHGDAEVPIGLDGFKKLWLELHQSGRVLKQGTEAVVWHKNRAVTSLMEGLPANSRKIGQYSTFSAVGVLSGKGRGAPLDNYIFAAPNDQTLVFVVGKMDQIENYIDEYVEVRIGNSYLSAKPKAKSLIFNFSRYPLAPSTEVTQLCCALQKKWNII